MKQIVILVASALLGLGCGSENSVLDLTGKTPPSSSATLSEKIVDKLIETNAYTNTSVEVSGLSSVYLKSANINKVLLSSTVQLNSDESWLFFPNIGRQQFLDSPLPQSIFVKGAAFKKDENVSVETYYNGICLKPIPTEIVYPATLSSGPVGAAAQKPVEKYTIYEGSAIPVGDDQLKSIFLKRGHMMTVAENADGTGASKVFIATDYHVNVVLPQELLGKVSYIRVLPWYYSCKKGLGGFPPLLASTGVKWYYDWGLDKESSDELEYVCMAWGGYATNPASIDKYISKKRVTHLLSFNEPDGADQSNLTAAKALELYPKLLKTGMRMGSPANKEGGWNTWLPAFMAGCKEKNYRVDFIAIHWYDWGNWGNTSDVNPANIDAMVERFRKNIEACYNKYKLPIWITEFNANKNRITPAQCSFVEKAIPMLESLPYVERYAYFRPFPVEGKTEGYGEFEKDNKLLPTGRSYGSIPSTPALIQ